MAKRWKKNLYENDGRPDNYTDETFLKELRINTDYQEYTLIQCIAGATALVEELCIVVLFVLVFAYLLNEWIEPSAVFFSTSLLTLIGFFYYRYESDLKTTVRQDIRTLLIFFVFGQIFSPVLHTLTDTISTDTIYTMTALMMFTHLVFFDYGVPVAIVSNSLSLSAAMFGSICLASRLASPFHAFVLMTVAIESFVLLPVLRTRLHFKFLTASIITILSLSILYTVSFTMLIILACTVLFINFLCPFMFLRWQRHKNNIYGPWDEAVVDDLENIKQLDCL